MRSVRGSSVTPVRSTDGIHSLTNADIAAQLLSVAQLLAAKGDNPYKIKAYRRAADSIKNLAESIDELVRSGGDLTQFPGIGKGMSGTIREIVLSGELGKLQALRAEVSPELSALSEYPRLDPSRVVRIYKKLGISSVAELKAKLESGELLAKVGVRDERHVRQALSESRAMLLEDADQIIATVEGFLRRLGARKVSAVGEARRRVEIVHDLSFLVASDDFPGLVARFKRFGGGAKLMHATDHTATFILSSGLAVNLQAAAEDDWGRAMIIATGSDTHLATLETSGHSLQKRQRAALSWATEESAYRQIGLAYIPPELREGHHEVEQAAAGTLPTLVTLDDIRGELHAHSTSSDGAHSIEEMADGAIERGYDYLGITDHSQSLKIAGGVSPSDLLQQIRWIDRWNEKHRRIRILKSAEVDILADGTLDYSDELLAELDYTICSIHSRFALTKDQQTERILRAMDNPYFNILGHATGRLLLRRAGYHIDIERVIEHARGAGCFFEINASPDRLDLSADHARVARQAGVKIAICTDAHSVGELDYIRCGIDQARRAGLTSADILNCRRWPELKQILKRR